MRQTPLDQLQTSRIALIKSSALGDIIHALPVLTALRQRYPRAHITWIVNRVYEPLLTGHPDLDNILSFDRHAIHSGIWQATIGALRFFRRLRRQHFDLVIDLQGLLRSGIMALACGSARRVGFSCAREGSRWFYTDIVPADFTGTHAVDRNWRMAEAFGAGNGDKQFRLHIDEQARQWVKEELHDCPRPWLAVGAGARWLTKRWPPEHFAALVRRAQKCFGGTALFIGRADEAPFSQKAAALLDGPACDFSGLTTLPQLVALLFEADVMLANDTGPLHLAAALGRPVLAPYTCTQAHRHGPFGQLSHAVETSVWCKGSYRKKCRRLECMSELEPDRLWPILFEMLRTWQNNTRSGLSSPAVLPPAASFSSEPATSSK
jgi:lipopolysaccharide heptosyltransferase I